MKFPTGLRRANRRQQAGQQINTELPKLEIGDVKLWSCASQFYVRTERGERPEKEVKHPRKKEEKEKWGARAFELLSLKFRRKTSCALLEGGCKMRDLTHG